MSFQSTPPKYFRIFIPFSVFLFLSLFVILPMPWDDAFESASSTIHFKLRGAKPLSEEIVLVYIGPEDIKDLGGWPLTRDYYGYVTHALHSLGAKVIGLNLLFDSHDPRFPEYDQILVDFFETAGNVCLPFAFFELNEEPGSGFYQGEELIEPLAMIKEAAAGLGFSNLAVGNSTSKVPVVARSGEDIVNSFGLELVSRFLGEEARAINTADKGLSFEKYDVRVPLDNRGQMWLNHFGDLQHVQSTSFVDLLQAFATNPDSAFVEGKIVLVDVTAPGMPMLFTTPYSEKLPSSLLHATVASNILRGDFLRAPPLWVQIQILLLLVVLSWIFTNNKGGMRIIAFTVITAAVMFFVSFVLFKQLNFIIQLFYPLAAIVLTGAGSFVLRTRSKSVSEASYQQLLKKEIALKEDELQASKAEFSDLQHQLFAETEASEQLRKLAEKRKLVVLELEKQLEDLSHYAIENAHADIAEFSEIICAPDSPLADVLALVAKVAPDDIPVLITGETGTGKELIAKAIHQKSNRNDAAFIAVNCGALSETLLESELFGHEKGSFTGASSRRRGRFELADKGTIFLDEITETSSNFQARLLRILQEGKFERLGGEHTLRVDVRVIAASNKDLPAAIEAGDFRNDLFYRLNGFPLSLPSLKERKQDIPLLCQHFLARLDDNQLGGFSERAMQLLQRYHWPGNVRELQNIVHRGAILARGEKQKLIKVEHLSSELRDGQFSREVLNDYQPLEAQVLESLRQLKFSRSAIGQTARALGNKDRGTITEHFRGICFQHLIQEGYDWDKAAQSVAGSVDASVVSKVRTKLDAYTRNLFPLPEPFDFDANEAHELPSQFKGLPKKFHPYLSEVIQYLRENEHESS